jgi:threonylcarbamoyladenosine tRNA methylthiotransferase MtaB
MQTVKFYTLGCKVNQYETQLIREQFLNFGFKEMDDSQPANIYVINTCTVTQKADSESLNLLHRARKENPQAKIMVTGCLTELDEDKIQNIDEQILIAKNKDKNKILEYIGINPDQLITYNLGLITHFKGHTRAFLKIQDGCNNFCSYCKVPLVRGSSRSRDLAQIIQEARQLTKNGYKEIVLCGICLGAYGRDFSRQIDLVDVIEELEKIEGLLRIRLSSIEASDISDGLIDKMAGSKKLCRHLHIPMQSGDDEILKKMNRKYTRADYLQLINKVKTRIPEIAITTDIMVGFPGESAANFQNTVGLVKEIQPLRVHIFPYSSRRGTPAFDFADKITPIIVKERISRLKDIARECSVIYRKRFLNKKIEVLIEALSQENSASWQGYTDNYMRVLVKSEQNLKNQLILVKLKKIVKDFIYTGRYYLNSGFYVL